MRICSLYMDTPDEVVKAQASVFDRFGLDLEQHSFKMGRNGSPSDSLALAIDELVESLHSEDVIALFDVDCIPLTKDAVPRLVGEADDGFLVGAAQQANHVPGSMPYVSHACMAFSVELFSEIGWPSFSRRPDSDVGVGVTEAARKAGAKVRLMWPSMVEEAKWRMDGDRWFGLGTTYEGRFYHSFQSRKDRSRFLRKCDEVMRGS